MERQPLKSCVEGSSDITALLHDVEAGEPAALDRLVEAAYPQLRRIAHRQWANNGHSSTLQCTAVVHETWLRLVQARHNTWKDRSHFFAFASRMMRSILVDYARSRRSMKRGGGIHGLSLIDTDASVSPPAVDILDLNEALRELEALDPLQGRIVELRYFSGLNIPETAEATGLSESTVKREWVVAKTWIRRRLIEGKNIP